MHNVHIKYGYVGEAMEKNVLIQWSKQLEGACEFPWIIILTRKRESICFYFKHVWTVNSSKINQDKTQCWELRQFMQMMRKNEWALFNVDFMLKIFVSYL